MNEKPNKRKSTKKGLNLISNIQSLISKDHKGITLVALIITIIVMLILVGVSITIAIKGGLFNISKRAAKDTKTEIEAEQELSNGRVKIGGIWYDSIEDYVGGKPSEDQKESGIKFEYEPKVWTKGPVKVKIEAEGTLQYSTDGVTWENYTKEIEVTSNGTIYAKEAGSSKEEKIVIENIDTEAPKISTELASPSQTTTSINLEISVADTASGISEIKWYYKKDGASGDYETLTDKYADKNGTEAGTKEVKATKELSKLEKGTTYNIYVVVCDVAGHETRIPETNTIDIKTIDSLLGKSATINEQKYIVIYEPGEKIEIDGTEYEITDAQLISANVLLPDLVYLGYKDGQVNWYSTNVIAEADLDNNDTLSSIEKAIYSYNHAIETLNKKCESLVDMTNTDIVSVRSVGSNPIEPNSENNTPYISRYSGGNSSGLFREKGKNEDENYLTDYNRMQLLGIEFSENQKLYWKASREIKKESTYDRFEIRIGLKRGTSTSGPIYSLNSSAANTSSNVFGVRPVITLKANALSRYLN